MYFDSNFAANSRRSGESFGAHSCCAYAASAMDAVVMTASIFVIVIIGVLDILGLLLAALVIILPVIIPAIGQTPVKRCDSSHPAAA